MQHFKVSRTIVLVFSFILGTIGCATSNNHVANADFGLTAESIPEGMLLTFSNIPKDATHMWINIISWGDTEEPKSQHSVVSSYAAIEEPSFDTWVNSTQQLDRVKRTGKIIFPIVQAGIKYHISTTIYNERERKLFVTDAENFQPRVAYTELIAANGINFNRDDVKLELNNTNSAVTLSSEPVFSSEVIFDEQKYRFGITIIVDNNRSVGVGDHHIREGLSSSGLSWEFDPQMTSVNLRNNEWLENGSHYSAWAMVHANIIYDDIKWCVEVTKTPEFDYAL